MDFWMFDRRSFENDLLNLFSALGDLQYEYDWVISDHEVWYAERCPDAVRTRWQWTGLLMDGAELTEHLRSGYVSFVGGGVLSAVPKGREQSRVDRFTPYWEHEDLFTPKYRFQTPLTQLELICYDGDWLLVCEPSFSAYVRTLPQAQTSEEHFAFDVRTPCNP